MSTARYAAALARVDPGVGYGRVYHYQDDAALLPTQDGATVTNLGATKSITLVLPAAVEGAEIPFSRLAGHQMVLVCSGLDQMDGGVTATTYTLNQPGVLVMACEVAGRWTALIRPSHPCRTVLYASDFPGADPLGNVECAAAINAAIEAASVLQGTCKIDGQFRCGSQITHKDNCIIEGSGDNFGSQLVFYTSGSEVPFLMDGANGAGGVWLKRAHIRNLTLNFTNSTSSAEALAKVVGCYSCSATDVVIFTDSAAHGSKIGFHVYGPVNDIRTTNLRRDGTDYIGSCIKIDSTGGPCNGVIITTPDMERASKGVWATGSANRLCLEVYGPYHESCSAGVYWDSANSGSSGLVVGGKHIPPNNSSMGIVFTQDNLTVVGGDFDAVGNGLASVYNAMTTRARNVHVYGGTHEIPIYDPNNWITTNSQRDLLTVWNRKVSTRKLATADSVLLPLFRVFPVYQHTGGPSGAPIAVKVCALVSVKNGNYGSRYQEFWYHVHSDGAGSVYESTLISGTPSVLENANYTVGITPSLTPHATLGYSTFNLTVNTGGALGNTQDYSVWATCEIIHDYINTESWVQAL